MLPKERLVKPSSRNQLVQNNGQQHISPVALFTYKKLEPLVQTIEALKNNLLAPHSELFIFSDGGKTKADNHQVSKVRSYIKQLTGFSNITIVESAENKGLATSIINGVSKILESYSSVIVLEDDLVTSSNFLSFMNQALTEYENHSEIHSISGYTMPIKIPSSYPYSNYFTKRASSWGWATWKNRWEEVDWNVSDYPDFIKDKKLRKQFNTMGSDLTTMLAKQMNGEISSWAIRWCYHQFKNDQYTVFPTISKISNIGFGESATHTKGSDNRFATFLDTSEAVNFNFNPKPELIPHFLKQFTAKYSLKTRVLYKFKNYLGLH